MDEILFKLKKHRLYKKMLKNKMWFVLLGVLAVLDIFWIYPRMHVAASTESVAIRLDKKSSNEGWVLSNGHTYYYDRSGNQKKGLTEIDGKTYYFDERMGYMKTGLVDVGDTKYYYGQDGTVLTGSQSVGNDNYYFDDTGKMYTGWLERDGERYYYGEDGKQLFGIHEIEGKRCLFNSTTGAYKDITVDPNKPMVCLTWDDGPADYTGEILDALEAVGGRGTFFVVGQRVEIYEETVNRAVDMGCEIANHTWEHAYLDTLSAEGIVEQITKTNDIVEQVTGSRPTLMRPTGGRVTNTVQDNVGMPMIYWSLDTQDWATQSISSTVNAILNNVQDGDIVLMHDLYDATAEASKTVIEELTKQGYQLVTVSELAAARGESLENGVVYYDFYPKNSAINSIETTIQ